MKQYINWSIASALLLSQSIVHAGGSGLSGSGVPSNMKFYAGASAGLSSHDGACNGEIEPLYSCDDKDTGYKVFGGVRLDPDQHASSYMLPAIGLEAGYIDFGENKASGKEPPRGDYKRESDNNISGIYAAAVGYLPVSANTEVMGKAGALFGTQESSVKTDYTNPITDNFSNDDVSALVGVGVQHKFSPNLAVRGEYERALKVGKDTVNETDASLLSVGAVFSTY